MRKGPGKEARLSFAGHATMENRHGLCVLFEVHPAVGAPESAGRGRSRPPSCATAASSRRPMAATKRYHTAEFVTGHA